MVRMSQYVKSGCWDCPIVWRVDAKIVRFQSCVKRLSILRLSDCVKGVCWDERVSPPDRAIKSINLSQECFCKVLLFRNLSSKIWNLQPNSLSNDARRSNLKGSDYYLLLLLLKSKVKRLQPFQIDIKPSEVPGGAYSYWLSLSIKALFLINVCGCLAIYSFWRIVEY